jgi:hypothetical protein
MGTRHPSLAHSIGERNSGDSRWLRWGVREDCDRFVGADESAHAGASRKTLRERRLHPESTGGTEMPIERHILRDRVGQRRGEVATDLRAQAYRLRCAVWFSFRRFSPNALELIFHPSGCGGAIVSGSERGDQDPCSRIALQRRSRTDSSENLKALTGRRAGRTHYLTYRPGCRVPAARFPSA